MKSLKLMMPVLVLFLTACQTSEDPVSQAAAQKNLKVASDKVPLQQQPTIEMFVFTDSKSETNRPPALRKGYKIRISLND